MTDTNFCCKVVVSQQKMSEEHYKMTVTDKSAGLRPVGMERLWKRQMCQEDRADEVFPLTPAEARAA